MCESGRWTRPSRFSDLQMGRCRLECDVTPGSDFQEHSRRIYTSASPVVHRHRQREKHQQLYRTATTDSTMRLNTLLVLLTLTFIGLTMAQAIYEDCCLKYARDMRTRTRKHVVSYRLQITDGGCNIPAVIFTMRKGREICADPKKPWVIELVKKLNGRSSSKDLQHRHRA